MQVLRGQSRRRTGGAAALLAGSVEVDEGVFGRIRRQAHTDRIHRASQSSAVLCPLAHLWILVYPKKWVQPRPPSALKYEPYQPPSQPHWERREREGVGGTPPLLCLKNNSIQTHPPPPLIALSWQVVGFLSVLLYKSPSEWPLLRKEIWRTKILSLFQRFWPTRLHVTIKTQDNVTKRTWVTIHIMWTSCIRYICSLHFQYLNILARPKMMLLVVLNILLMDVPQFTVDKISSIIQHIFIQLIN